MEAITQNSELVLKKIKELPPLPLVVQKLLQVMEDQNSSAEDISKVLSSDQAMASKVLKLVNSSFYGLSGQVSTISRAVIILGVSAIRNLALGLSAAQIMSHGEKGVFQAQFWEHSIATAASAEILARTLGYEDPEEAFITGLLHDIGQLVFLMTLPKVALDIYSGQEGDFLALEKHAFGMDHAHAGLQLLKHWKLPRSLQQAIRYHHNAGIFTGKDNPLTSIVAMADSLASVFGNRFETPLAGEDFPKLVRTTKLEIDQVKDILERIKARKEETRLFLRIATGNEVGTDSVTTGEPLKIVLICTDPQRVAWVQQVLDFLGHENIPMKQFFAQAQQGTFPDLVILHPASITPEQLTRMKPQLEEVRQSIALLEGSHGDQTCRVLAGDFPCLPLGMSAAELENIRNLQTQE